MPQIYELNLGMLEPVGGPPGPSCCRCLLVETPDGCMLVDTGFGKAELQFPEKFFGEGATDKWHILADPDLAALSQLERIGLHRQDIRHIICTHLDMDHAGGLVDFPHAAVHLSRQEYDSLANKHPRYFEHQFRHNPCWAIYGWRQDACIAGLSGWTVFVGSDVEVSLIPLFGHSAGQCGVLINSHQGTLLHAGDSYYRKTELGEGHPSANEFPLITADDNAMRLRSLDLLCETQARHPQLRIVSTHDREETTAYASLPPLAFAS